MPNTLKVYVNLAKETEQTDLQLVLRGFPTVTESRDLPNVESKKVLGVAVFKLNDRLTKEQLAFLTHLKRNEHAIHSWEFIDGRDVLVDQG